MQIQRAQDIAVITHKGGLFERVGEVACGEFDCCKFEQVGDIHKFSQTGKSKSLRISRVTLKTMRREAFA